MKNFIRRLYSLWRVLPSMRLLRSRVILLIAVILICSVFTSCGYTKPSNNYEDIPRDQQSFTETLQPSSMDREPYSVNSITSNEAVPDSVSPMQEQPNELLEKLDCVASFALKILCIVTLVEIVKFLNNFWKYMEEQQEQHAKRLRQRSKQDSSAQAHPDLFDFGRKFCDTSSMISTRQSSPEPGSMPYERPAAYSDLNTEKEYLPASQVDEYDPSGKTVLFEFQAQAKALKILDGAEQGCIFLKKSVNGELKGIQMEPGRYRVSLRSLEMPERYLRYSAIAACFNISWEVEGGKVLQVRVDNEAFLEEVDAEIYKIFKKGQLTVINVIG